MGLIIVTVVGAILGWLAAIILERDDGRAMGACALAGCLGAWGGAVISGDVPLILGVSAVQLLVGALGAVIALAVLNIALPTRAKLTAKAA